MILLTDEEIKGALRFMGEDVGGHNWYEHTEKAIAKSQLKKVVEWGDEDCTDRSQSGTMKKRECGFCWQALLEEIGELL